MLRIVAIQTQIRKNSTTTTTIWATNAHKSSCHYSHSSSSKLALFLALKQQSCKMFSPQLLQLHCSDDCWLLKLPLHFLWSNKRIHSFSKSFSKAGKDYIILWGIKHQMDHNTAAILGEESVHWKGCMQTRRESWKQQNNQIQHL